MSHVITIACDSCGHEARFTGYFTDTAECLQKLVHRDGWQRVTFTAADGDLGEDTTTEYYCPSCMRYPDAERTELDRSIDIIESNIRRACILGDLSDAYNLVDDLADLYARAAQGEGPTHAAAD